MRSAIIAITITFLASGCTSSMPQSLEGRFRAMIGKEITLIGIADQAWGGASLSNDECYLVIRDLDSWPDGILGQKVEVTATLQSVDRPNGVTDTNYKEAPIMLDVVHATWKEKASNQSAKPTPASGPRG